MNFTAESEHPSSDQQELGDHQKYRVQNGIFAINKYNQPLSIHACQKHIQERGNRECDKTNAYHGSKGSAENTGLASGSSFQRLRGGESAQHIVQRRQQKKWWGRGTHTFRRFAAGVALQLNSEYSFPHHFHFKMSM